MSKKIITIMAAIALIGIGTFAYAHWNEGWGQHGWMYGGYGMPHEYYGDQRYDDLSDDQIKSLEKERDVFFEETEKIREDLYAKQLELQSELFKSDPDTARAAELQKEISELEAQLDQKRIDHMIKLRKLNPETGRGFASMGHMMNYGSNYPGACRQ